MPLRAEDWTDRRGQILGALEDASQTQLPADDSLPDTLIAAAQSLRMHPHELKSWIYDSSARGDWTIANLTRFAQCYGFARNCKNTAGAAPR